MAPVSPSPASAAAPATAFPLPSGWKVPPTVEVAIMFHALVEVVEVSVVVVGANHWNGCYVVLGILLKILCRPVRPCPFNRKGLVYILATDLGIPGRRDLSFIDFLTQ